MTAGASLGLFVALALVRVFDHPFPWYDDVAYLDLGNQARELGGPFALVRALYAGHYAEKNRHPLYTMLTSLVAGRDPGFHRRAQLMTVGLGVLALLAVWRVARRHLGARAGLATLALLAVSETMIAGSARESCEPLLVAFWALSLGAMVDGEERPRAWIAAGAWAGLAFLSKGTGIFLPVVFALTLLASRRFRALVSPHAIGLGLAFVAVASPVLVRNLRLYGTPLAQDNARYFWIDRLPDFAETFAPHALDRLPDGPRAYLAQTSATAVLSRVGRGLGETVVHLGDAMSLVSPRPFGPLHVAWIVVGLVAALAALRLLARARPGFARTLLLVQSAWFFGFFAFFNATGGASRYVFPMTMTWVAVLARAMVARHDARERWCASPWARRAFGLGALAVVTALAFDRWPRRDPPGFSEVQAWLVGHLRDGDVYAVDARTYLQPRWRLAPGIRQEIVSASWREAPVPASELLAWMRAKGVRYAVLDASARDAPNTGPRYFFYDRLPLGADGSLPAGPLPSGTHVVYRDGGNGAPCRWMVLEIDAR